MWKPAKHLTDYLFQNDSGIILTKSVTKKKPDLGHFWLDNTNLVESVFSIRCQGLIQGISPPALLCHKEPAQGTQSPLLGVASV